MRPTIKWRQHLPEPGALPDTNEIHLWQTDLDELPVSTHHCPFTLSIVERERARRFVFAQHRRRYLATRAWLRSVIGAYLNVPPHELPLAANACGKPCVAAEANHAGLRFNLSHCDQLALLAITIGRDVGVDLQNELPDTAWPAIAKRFCATDEWEHIQALPSATRATAFTEIWTRKEAAGKAVGEGLNSRIQSFAVGPADWGTIDCGGGLLVWSLPAQNRFAAAIAVQEPVVIRERV